MCRLSMLVATVLLALPAAHATASIYTVDVTGDANSSCTIGSCSLREAIHAANTDTSSNQDIVDLDGLTVHLTITGRNEDANATGDLDIGTPNPASFDTAGPLTIENGTIVASNGDRVLQLLPGESVKLSNVTFQGGDATASTDDDGGGLYVDSNANADLFAVTFTGNVGDSGGAMFTNSGSTVTIDQSTFDGNNGSSGGAISVHSDLAVTGSTFTANGATARGGALDVSNGTFTLTDSLLQGNHAYDGGGIAVETSPSNTITASSFVGNTATEAGGGLFVQHPTAAKNVTFTGNAAQDPVYGGGAIFLQGDLNLQHGTLAGDTGGGATGIRVVLGTLTTANTLVAETCSLADAAIVNTLGGNVDTGVTCGFVNATDRRNQTIRLGPLTSFGQHQVLPLLGGSGAIDAGVAGYCAATDERGVTRIASECDAGSYEAAKTDLRAALAITPTALLLGDSFTLALTAFNDGPRATGGVIATIPLPAGTTFVSGTGDGGAACDPGPPVTCPLGSLDPGASHTASVVVKPSAAGAVSFTGSVLGDLADAAPGNESASGQGTVAPPDTTKPTVKLALRKGTTRRSIRRTRRIGVKVTVDEAAALTLRAAVGGKALGKAGRAFVKAGSATMTIKLTRKAAARLRTAKKLTISASARDAAGNVGTTRRVAKLKR